MAGLGRRAVVTVVVVGALLAGCTTSPSTPSSPAAAGSSPTAPSATSTPADPFQIETPSALPHILWSEPLTLLTWKPMSGGAQMTALVSGELGVNDRGCVTLGHAVLLAPPGSVVLSDGNGINLAGRGEVHWGERVSGLGGGYGDYPVDATEHADLAGCRSRVHPEREFVGVNQR